MRKILQKSFIVAERTRDIILAMVGRSRVCLGEWPDNGVVDAAVSTLQEFGGEKLEKTAPDLAFDIENIYFRVKGHRVRLCIEEYGEISLWGAKRIVAELTDAIARRLPPGKAQLAKA